MIPFPGESLGVDSFENVSGNPIAAVADVTFRDGSSAFAAGDAAKVVVFFGINYLEDDTTPGDVSWCIEITGGTGTLTLTECLGDGAPDTPLGSFDVTAPGPLVVPSSVITLADVYNEFYGSLLIECASGAVDVQQVKLRAFPTGGPLGGWGDTLHPSWTIDDRLPEVFSFQRDINATSFAPFPRDVGAVYADLNAGLLAGWDEDVEVAPAFEGAYIQGQVSVVAGAGSTHIPAESGGGADATTSGFLVHRDPVSPGINPAEGLEDGVDYIASPYEVWGDPVGFVTAADDAYSDWNATSIQFEIGPGSLEGSDAEFAIAVQAWAPTVDPIFGTITIEWPDGSASAPGPLELPDDDDVLIASTHGWINGQVPAPDVPGDIYGDVDVFSFVEWEVGTADFNPAGPNAEPLTYVSFFPPYRVWDINAVTVTFRKLRQLHRDDGRGGTPPRAFGGASRIRTGRAYGYD